MPKRYRSRSRGGRYKRRQYANASVLARKAYTMAKRLQPEVRLIEFGYSTLARCGSAAAGAGSFVNTANPFVGIEQGNGANDRSGHVINPSGIEYELDFDLVDSTGTRAFNGGEVWTRVLVFQTYDYAENSYITPDELFEANTVVDGMPDMIFSNYKSKASYVAGNQRTRKFKVLYDKKFMLYDHSGRDKFSKHMKFMVRNMQNITYSGVAGSTVQNPIQLMIFTDNGSTTAVTKVGAGVRYKMRLYFQDK